MVAVLSGGGAKAAAHVGAIKALDERQIAPTHFVGTSMGAVIAACFACRLSYVDLLKRISLVERADVARASPSLLAGPFATSLLRDEPLRETIAALVPARTFRELALPLTVTAVDADNGQLVLFGVGGRSHIPLVDALYASCALPVYYPAARIGDRRYVDGGVRAVLPLDVAAQLDPDLIFGVHVGPWLLDEPPDMTPAFVPPLLKAHTESMRILMAAQVEDTIARHRNGRVPVVLVRPLMRQQATFRVDAVADYVAEGYRAAVRELGAAEAAGGAPPGE